MVKPRLGAFEASKGAGGTSKTTMKQVGGAEHHTFLGTKAKDHPIDPRFTPLSAHKPFFSELKIDPLDLHTSFHLGMNLNKTEEFSCLIMILFLNKTEEKEFACYFIKNKTGECSIFP